MRAPDQSGTGLEALGAGLKALSGGVEQVAITADERQDHLDKLNARNLALGFREAVRPAVDGFTLSEGQDAVNGWQPVQTQVEDAAKAALERASNPRMRAYTDDAITAARAQYIDRISEHAGKQQRVMADQTYTAERDTALSDAANLRFTDPDKADRRLADAQGAQDRLAHLHGWTGPVAGANWQDQVDKLHNGVIDQAIASDHVTEASQYFEKNQGAMSLGARNKAIQALQKPLEARQADADFATISSGPIPKGSEGTVPTMEPARIEGGTYHAPVMGRVSNTYAQHEARGSHGLDIAASAGSAVHPIAGGVVESVGHDKKSGNFVVIKHPDGHTSSYSHLAQVSVEKGHPVAANAVLGTVGMTGHTTGPHVHLRTKDANGKDVDPQKLLGTAAAGGTANVNAAIGSTNAPRRWDKAALYAAIDSHSDWTPERKDRARAEVDRRVSVDDNLINRQQEDAADAAYSTVAQLGDKGFTDINKIPAAVRSNLRPETLISLQNMADANKKRLTEGTEVKPNGPDAIHLDTMRYYDPEGFKTTNLGQYVGKVSKAELDGLMVQQAQMRTAKPADWSPRQGIVTAVSYGEAVGGLKLKVEEKAAVMQIMEAGAIAARASGKPVDYDALFRDATRSVKTTGFFGGHGEKPRYQLELKNMPNSQRQRLTDRFRARAHRAPTDDELLQLYRADVH